LNLSLKFENLKINWVFIKNTIIKINIFFKGKSDLTWREVYLKEASVHRKLLILSIRKVKNLKNRNLENLILCVCLTLYTVSPWTSYSLETGIIRTSMTWTQDLRKKFTEKDFATNDLEWKNFVLNNAIRGSVTGSNRVFKGSDLSVRFLYLTVQWTD
jgi:hypothetical protein